MNRSRFQLRRYAASYALSLHLTATLVAETETECVAESAGKREEMNGHFCPVAGISH